MLSAGWRGAANNHLERQQHAWHQIFKCSEQNRRQLRLIPAVRNWDSKTRHTKTDYHTQNTNHTRARTHKHTGKTHARQRPSTLNQETHTPTTLPATHQGRTPGNNVTVSLHAATNRSALRPAFRSNSQSTPMRNANGNANENLISRGLGAVGVAALVGSVVASNLR